MEREIRKCAECESDYYADSSQMLELCVECSHYLYGYLNCIHQMEKGRCVLCYWDGSSTVFIDGIKRENGVEP